MPRERDIPEVRRLRKQITEQTEIVRALVAVLERVRTTPGFEWSNEADAALLAAKFHT